MKFFGKSKSLIKAQKFVVYTGSGMNETFLYVVSKIVFGLLHEPAYDQLSKSLQRVSCEK